MSISPKILILGAAGYLGGTFLTEILKTHDTSDITALIRDSSKQSLFEPAKINTVVGTVEDINLLRSLVEANDIVVNFAVPFAGGDESIKAIVEGLEKRAATSSIKPILLQTSGTGSVMYGSNGEAGTDVWKDSDHDRWEALPDTAFFHSGDRIVARAAQRGIISAYIIMSPTVYGQGTGPGNKLSLQIPAYVRYAKRTGQAGYIGKGENIWGNVHVQDLIDLYLLVMGHALKSPSATAAEAGSHGWSNLIYGGLKQHTWKPVIELIGDQLFARGDIPNKSAISLDEGAGDMYMFGTNSFMEVSEKAKALGWSQKQPDILEAIKLALPVQK
ncbi:hypothetical protein IAR55_000006 [Kwoniella newhampshirensis]|uniref:NAD-dependent epimerase/dehydratase domain-containing protein n=1 Tax=Kwoniella newhampshirensis TaxID=1651941 RepID=A0AAW0Z5F4_9TREE